MDNKLGSITHLSSAFYNFPLILGVDSLPDKSLLDNEQLCSGRIRQPLEEEDIVELYRAGAGGGSTWTHLISMT